MKKQLTVEQIFQGMPRLKTYFKNMDYEIKRFDVAEGGSAVEALKEKRERLLKTAREMDIEDLNAVYYVNNIKALKPYQIVRTLKKINDSLEELRNIPNVETEKIDGEGVDGKDGGEQGNR